MATRSTRPAASTPTVATPERGTPRPAALAAVGLVAVGAALTLSACGNGGDAGVQREVPGAAQSSVSTGPDGTDLHLHGRNVDLTITGAVVKVSASGNASLDFTVKNNGPVNEHLAVATIGGTQATLTAGRSSDAALSTAGILLGSEQTETYGADDGPSALTPTPATVKVGATTTVMLQFGVAGMVQLHVPVQQS